MAHQQAIILDARNNIIRIQHPALPPYPQTVSTAITAGATSLTVGDNIDLDQNQFIMIGQIGQPRTEVVRITAAVNRGTALTVTACVFDHPADTPVQLVLWDTFRLSGADTVTGSKTQIAAAVDIDYGMPDTEYKLSTAAGVWAYYFVDYKNSQSSASSEYSDAAPAAGYSPDTVRMVKKTALSDCGESTDEVITDDFLNTEITNCSIEIWKKKRKWAQFEIQDANLGTISAGVIKYAMPSDISDPNTNEAIRSIRVRQTGALRYVQQEVYDDLRYDTALTTVLSTASVGATTLNATSTADFQDDGSLWVLEDSVTYTGKTATSFTGVPASGEGSITATAAAGVNIWQGTPQSLGPAVYTVTPGYVNLILPPTATYWDRVIYISYYSRPTYPNSDADGLDWPDPILYHRYLAWKINLRRHNGTPTPASAEFKRLYDEREGLLMNRARMQDTPRFTPSVPYRRQQAVNASDDGFIPWIIS